MLVEQIWTGNDFRNFNYLVACPETGDALAIDPLNINNAFQSLKTRDGIFLKCLIPTIIMTILEEIRVLLKVQAQKVLAHAQAKDQIPDMDEGLSAGDIVKIGKTVELEVMDTPGHTMSHICLYSKTEIPALFAG